ncbi:hypothetical protein Ddye_016757 [Dipteronia dyeriana]|uniref:tRNA nucleotidyltransferase/poly(A) polymerase RNA and SrmB- binding domain-containing protein n=1 Tax=Dipteronia dyeriana TaxID=168575 RepID=A0AAD9U825_9ROSI|nr:hypothetical protein Ddye_016757 [Dipteronia dyeriana]
MLRGLRIAARLGLSLTKDTETEIHKLSPSNENLDQFRLMLELNYMSYGAVEPSICLLHKFKLLEMFLPFHELLFNLIKLVSCDRPAHCNMWTLTFECGLILLRLLRLLSPTSPTSLKDC